MSDQEPINSEVPNKQPTGEPPQPLSSQIESTVPTPSTPTNPVPVKVTDSQPDKPTASEIPAKDAASQSDTSSTGATVPTSAVPETVTASQPDKPTASEIPAKDAAPQSDTSSTGATVPATNIQPGKEGEPVPVSTEVQPATSEQVAAVEVEDEPLPDTSTFYLFDDPKYDRDRITAQARLFSSFIERQGQRIITGSVKKILDLGCGEGTLTYSLARTFPGSDILAIDNSPAAIEQALGYFKRRPPTRSHIEFRVQDVEVALPEGPFDLIHISAVLMHLKQPDKVLQHCWAALKPGGSIWIKEVPPESGRNVSHPHWQRFRDLIEQTMAKYNRDLYISTRVPGLLEGAKFINIKEYLERYNIEPDTFGGRTVMSVALGGFYNARHMIAQALTIPEAELTQLHKDLVADSDKLRGNASLVNIVAQRPIPTQTQATNDKAPQ